MTLQTIPNNTVTGPDTTFDLIPDPSWGVAYASELADTKFATHTVSRHHTSPTVFHDMEKDDIE